MTTMQFWFVGSIHRVLMRIKHIATGRILQTPALLGIVFLLIKVGIDVIQKTVDLSSLCGWLIAIALMCGILVRQNVRAHVDSLDNLDALAISFFILTGLGLLAWFGTVTTHFHQDEFIHAYAAFNLPPIDRLDWFSGFPKDYLAKFPFLWYILQKPFFFWLGPTVWAVRISSWPYYVLVIIGIYGLSKELFNRGAAIASTALFITLAPNIYLSSLGLQNISSTCFFVIALLSVFRILRYFRWQNEVVLGLVCGLSFLTNTASYITYPIVVLIMLIEAIRTRSFATIGSLARVSALCFVILAPFLVSALCIENYFLQRVQQVNFLTGTWSDIPQKIESGVSIWIVISQQLVSSIRSIFQPGIGGLGGFTYGGLSLFDPVTAVLWYVSVLYLIYRIALKRDVKSLYLFLSFLFPFLLGFVFTTHPPPFHRIAILYPLFAVMIIALGDQIVGLCPQPSRRVIGTIGIALLMVINIWHGLRMVDKERALYLQDTRILGDYFNAQVELGTSIAIAAFPSFHFGAELLFRTSNKFTFITDTTPVTLSRYNGKIPLVLLNMQPETQAELIRNYPKNLFVPSINGEALSAVALFMPPSTL